MLRAVANPLASGALPSNVTSASLNSITPTGGLLAVTGSISARNSTGAILAEDSRAVTVGIGGRLNMRGRDDNGNYQNYGSIASWLTDGTPGAYAADTVLYTSLGGALAERVRLFSAGGASVTGSISATTRVNYPSFTVATLPAVGSAGGNIYVSDESGGAQPAFSDGTNWRRYTDRAVVS